MAAGPAVHLELGQMAEGAPKDGVGGHMERSVAAQRLRPAHAVAQELDGIEPCLQPFMKLTCRSAQVVDHRGPVMRSPTSVASPHGSGQGPVCARTESEDQEKKHTENHQRRHGGDQYLGNAALTHDAPLPRIRLFHSGSWVALILLRHVSALFRESISNKWSPGRIVLRAAFSLADGTRISDGRPYYDNPAFRRCLAVRAGMPVPPRAAANCRAVDFEGNGYAVCSFDPAQTSLELHWRNGEGVPHRTFSALSDALAEEGAQLTFAINGGMFQTDFTPVGLHIEGGVELRPLNRYDAPSGMRPVPNFYKKPNGVFYVDARRRRRAEIGRLS